MATEEDRKFYKEHRHEPYQQLRRAMETCDLRKIRYLIRSEKVDPNVRGIQSKQMPLWYSLDLSLAHSVSVSQKKELIRLMVAHGADIHVKGYLGINILQATSSTPLLKFLLTEFKFSNEEIWTAFTTAGKPLRFFIKYGLQVSKDMVEYLFHRAYDVKFAKFLMTKYHVSVNCVDKEGLMPIHYAVIYNRLEKAKFLLKHGADVNSRSCSGEIPLMFTNSLEVEIAGSLATVKTLVEQYHFDVNQTDKAGISLLMLATGRGDWDIAKYLVENGANVNAVDNGGRNALFYLYENNEPDEKLLQYLIAQGVNVNNLDKSGKNVLFYATKYIDLLLKAGADATVVADDGTTVLMNYSLSFSNFKLLIQHGADPSEYAEKLLHWWLENNHDRKGGDEEIMLYLIENYFLDPNTKNEAGRTPLFYGRMTCVDLIELGASCEITDNEGNTPLIYWFANEIFAYGSLYDCPPQYYQRQNNEGKTALHYAVIRDIGGFLIKDLLDCGADWRIKDNSGRTAMDYARELKRFDICELMENYKHKNIKGS